MTFVVRRCAAFAAESAQSGTRRVMKGIVLVAHEHQLPGG